MPGEPAEIQLSAGLGEAFTRSSVEGKWDGGEELVISAGKQTKRYTVTKADGSGGSSCTLAATSDGKLYWTRTDTMHVSGYYAPDQTLTHKYKIQTGQNVDNAFRKSDILYAPPTVVDYGNVARLTFRHLTALVKLTVTADDDLNVSNINVANIKIVNQHNESDSVRADGTVRQRTTANKYQITPNNVSSDSSQRTVRALLVPQRTSGITFLLIVVNLGDDTDGTTFYYTPTGNEEINLEAGKSYTFNVRLTRRGIVMTKASVENWSDTVTNVDSSDRELTPSNSSSAAWDEGYSSDINSTIRENEQTN
jgi:hypothetical protein